VPGPPPKEPSKRIRRQSGLSVIDGLGATAKAPPTPPDLCSEALKAWNEYWQDVVAGMVRVSDQALTERWIRNMDRYYTLLHLADADPMVAGVVGQTRPNPLYTLAYNIEASIKDDEKQLGIGPLNRVRLGLVLSESRKSLTELNAEAEIGEKTDPRAGFGRARVSVAKRGPQAEVVAAPH
jgi:hypothetical protein